jgi:N-acetylglucosamine kinase-like BadF-type ATPase
MSAVLAVDLGKSGCRAALWLDGDEPVQLADGPGTAGLAGPAGLAAAEAAIGNFCQQLLGQAGQRPVAICVGAAGAAAAGPAAASLADRLCELPTVSQSVVCSDAVIAHAGALGGGPGVVLVAGTGAVAYGIDSAGVPVQVDGWGPMLGDSGGGGWIGLAGLRAALRDQDGRDPASTLSRAAIAAFGELAGLPGQLASHANPARLAATFAAEVGRQAAAGDPVASAILAEAASQLAGSVIAAVERLATRPPFDAGAGGGRAAVPVALTGGLLKLGPVLLEPLHRVLREALPPITVQPPLADPLAGARLLASRCDTAAEPLLYRSSRSTRPTPGR